MILSLVLLLGCAVWVLGELATLATGGIGTVWGSIAATGMSLSAIGVFALKDLPGMGKPGRVGIVLSAFGAFSFAMVLIILLSSGALDAMAEGAIGYGDVVYTPFYILALVFTVCGLAAFALHFRAAPEAGPADFVVPALLAVGFAAELVLADLPAFHEILSAGFALYLAWLGGKRLKALAA